MLIFKYIYYKTKIEIKNISKNRKKKYLSYKYIFISLYLLKINFKILIYYMKDILLFISDKKRKRLIKIMD